jgi:NAD(P)-dependent dehydrogenase (short-subunit alcohol dehydrogenase family)
VTALLPDAQPPARGGLWRKVAVVVGGGSGVGRAIAKAVARQGANVVVADFDRPRMERTVEEILQLGASEAAIALATDVRSDGSVRSLARDSVKSMGHVDIVVNAAGVLLQGKLERITTADWTWMLETNLLGAVRTTNAFLPQMMERRSGHIVNAVSFGGLLPGDPMTIPYDTGHAALAAFTESVAQQLQGTGVFVSLYCPGSKSPRIGQNTRSRGMGRWLGGVGAEQGPRNLDQLVDGLIDSFHHPKFLVLGDPAESAALEHRWERMNSLSSKQESISKPK